MAASASRRDDRDRDHDHGAGAGAGHRAFPRLADRGDEAVGPAVVACGAPEDGGRRRTAVRARRRELKVRLWVLDSLYFITLYNYFTLYASIGERRAAARSGLLGARCPRPWGTCKWRAGGRAAVRMLLIYLVASRPVPADQGHPRARALHGHRRAAVAVSPLQNYIMVV